MSTSTLNLDLQSQISDFDHTPFYCEENVYMLCHKLCTSGIADAKGSDLFVVFISNEKRQNLNAYSRYHCGTRRLASGQMGLLSGTTMSSAFREKDNSPHLVWDLDSSLPFPSPLDLYVSEAIRPSFQLFPEYQRYFRIVHSPIFVRTFASDRRHMKDASGNWTAQPPPYDPITAEDGTIHNLNEYVEIRNTDVASKVEIDSLEAVYTQRLGIVVGETQLVECFSRLS